MRTTVMEGSLSDFDLMSVVEVVSLGRQYTSIELFDERGDVVGTLFLKSGKILGATTGASSGLAAVTSLLRGASHKRFSVYRTEPIDDVLSPVGSVGEILLRMVASDPDPSEGALVMEGTFAEFDLLTVLQVISIGRQLTTVQVEDHVGNLLGSIQLKSGKVLSATSDHLSGVDAMRRLARCGPDCRFIVYRSSDIVTAEAAIGDLGQILLQLEAPDDDWGEESKTHVGGMSDLRAPLPPPTQPKMAQSADARQFVEAPTASRGLWAVPASERSVPVICLTGPKGGAGKTTVAINLGVAFARQGKRVVLVDADANGVLLALNAVEKATHGALEIITGQARLSDVAIKTRIPNLRIVPASDLSTLDAPAADAWARLFREARADADIVLVDTCSAIRGPSHVHAACSHALIVLPAEPTAIRALPVYLKRLAALGSAAPAVLGIVLNMLDYRARVSLDVLCDLCGGPSAAWVFDIPIARSNAFMEAVARGVPVCRSERADTPTIGWVFEMLASGILERLGILTPVFDETLLS